MYRFCPVVGQGLQSTTAQVVGHGMKGMAEGVCTAQDSVWGASTIRVHVGYT